MRPRWVSGPAELVLVRHGESAANLADAAARAAGAEALDLADRDADVALSETGRAQAGALGRWLLDTDEARRPTVVVSSPYRRARDTAAGAAGPLGLGVELDERLRERDLGLLDGLTPEGVRSRLPDEAERRARLGKFWYVPPSGGELGRRRPAAARPPDRPPPRLRR